MSWGAHDVYYNPEYFGLRLIGTLDQPLSYAFDMFAVWIDNEGQLYYASDAGCSCPSHFEDHRSIDDLTKANSWEEIIGAMKDWDLDYAGNHKVSAAEFAELVTAVVRRTDDFK